MGKFKKSLFFKPKNKKLAKAISIKSPAKFKASIKKLKKGGITTKEKRALNLAQTRAKLQLRRKNLSPAEKKEFKEIKNMELPKITQRKKKKPLF